MFTGIVRELGHLTAAPEDSGQGGVRLRIGHSAELGAQLTPGASLAVSGVCLTVLATGRSFGVESEVELSRETLARTRLGRLSLDEQVNLEPALRAGDPLGGHWAADRGSRGGGCAPVAPTGHARVRRMRPSPW